MAAGNQHAENSPMGVAAIALGVASGVALLALPIVGVVYVVKKTRRMNPESDDVKAKLLR